MVEFLNLVRKGKLPRKKTQNFEYKIEKLKILKKYIHRKIKTQPVWLSKFEDKKYNYEKLSKIK